jgi:putative transposase
MQRFRRLHRLQKFVSVHSSACNHFNHDRSLASRDFYKMNRAAVRAEWRALCAC